MGKAGGWLDVLGPAIGAVAGVMVVAGTYLLDPTVVDLGFALTAERTWLVGAFLIAAGLAFAFKLAWPKGIASGSVIVDLLAGLVLGDLSHYGYGFIAGTLGVQALFAETPNYWAALLLVPALLSFVIAFSEDDDDGVDEAEVSRQEEDDIAEEAETESGSADVRDAAWESLALGGFFSFYAFAFMAVIGFAAQLYLQLKRSVIDGETPDLGNLPIWEASLVTLSTLALLAVGFALALAAIFFFSTIWSSRQATPETNRAPRPADDAFIEVSEKAVRDYAVAQGYDRNNSHWDFFEFISVVAVGGVGAIVMFGGIAMLEGTPAGPSFPVVLSPSGASALFAFFAILMLAGVPKSIWSRLSRRFSERAGWVLLRPKKNPGVLRDKLIAFVRAGRLSTATPIKPGEFLHAANLSVERHYYVPAAVLIAVALLLLHRDVNTADVLTANAIEVTDYWTFTKTRYGYDDVGKVELRCFLTDKDEPVEAYVLHFKDGQSLDIYKKQAVVEAQLAAYEAIDAKLVALGVPFVPGSHQGWFKRDERGYDADCVETLAEEFPEALRPRVKRLFHVGEMAAVEGIWPWDDTLGLAKRAGDAYEVKKAVALYTQAIASGRLPANLRAFAYFGRAEARYDYEVAYGLRDGEVILALKDYRKAREIEPTQRVYGREGGAYILLGAYDEAKAAYRKALELDQPRPHWPLIGLARIERIQGNYDAAMAHLDELLRVWGERDATMPIYFHRAWVLYLKNDYAAAVDAIAKGLVFQPDYSGAFQVRACGYAQLGEFDKAKADIELANTLLRAGPESDAWAKTPWAKSLYADYERDRTTIAAMQAGAADDAARASLCSDSWNTGYRLRTRSPLLPAGG